MCGFPLLSLSPLAFCHSHPQMSQSETLDYYFLSLSNFLFLCLSLPPSLSPPPSVFIGMEVKYPLSNVTACSMYCVSLFRSRPPDLFDAEGYLCYIRITGGVNNNNNGILL